MPRQASASARCRRKNGHQPTTARMTGGEYQRSPLPLETVRPYEPCRGTACRRRQRQPRRSRCGAARRTARSCSSANGTGDERHPAPQATAARTSSPAEPRRPATPPARRPARANRAPAAAARSPPAASPRPPRQRRQRRRADEDERGTRNAERGIWSADWRSSCSSDLIPRSAFRVPRSSPPDAVERPAAGRAPSAARRRRCARAARRSWPARRSRRARAPPRRRSRATAPGDRGGRRSPP